MNEAHIARIASELSLRPGQVGAVAALLEEGSTVPFISRYRKEASGSLDEVAITAIRDRLGQLKDLDARRNAILKSLEERGLLSQELKQQINQAETLTTLEDIYLPFKPKRRTRATIAREKGLEPLAERIDAQEPGTDPAAEARAFVDPDKGIASVEDVDTAISNGFGRRTPVYGTLEHQDVVGLDMAYAIQKYMGEALCNETEPVSYFRDIVESGNLGAKSGRGFYDWSKKDLNDVINRRDRFLIELAKAEKRR